MNIEINRPELVAFIQQRLESGAYKSAEDFLAEALLTACDEQQTARGDALAARDLVELFATSPFAGLNMDFERDKDTGREIEL